MLTACLILGQRSQVFVVTQQTVLEALALLDRIGDRWTSDDKSLLFHTRERFEGLDLLKKPVPDFLTSILSEFEKNYIALASFLRGLLLTYQCERVSSLKFLSRRSRTSVNLQLLARSTALKVLGWGSWQIADIIR